MKVDKVFNVNAQRIGFGYNPLSEDLMNELLTAAHEVEFSELLTAVRGKGFVTTEELRSLRVHHCWNTHSLSRATEEIDALLANENLEIRS